MAPRPRVKQDAAPAGRPDTSSRPRRSGRVRVAGRDAPASDVARAAPDGPERRFTFTVFTPTRNRGHVLRRVYESLRRQTFTDFEWLIVDNESTDDTPAIVAAWQAAAPFPIRYIRHRNRGLHVSRDRAVEEARGELFVEFRSADSCMPEALQRFLDHWHSIPEAERDGFAGVTVLVMDERGRMIGRPFPRDVIDSNPNELFYRYGLRGERWGFQRTDVLRAYPKPVLDGYTGYVPEGAIWSWIGRRYQTRFVNEVLRVYWLDQPTSLSNPTRFADNALGGLIETQGFLDHDVHWFTAAPMAALLRAAKYVRCSLHVGRGPREQWRALRHPGGRALWAAALPLGVVTYIIDRTGRTQLLDRLGIEKT